MSSITFCTKKSLGKVEDMIIHDPAGEKPCLFRINDAGKGINNESMDGGGDEAVVSIGHYNGSGIFYYSQSFFRNEVEKTTIEVVWW